MSHTCLKIALAQLLACIGLTGALAEETTSQPRYSLRTNDVYQSSSSTTSLSRGAPYPLKKRYSDFTQEEKASMRAMYEGMPDGDEPPFPAAGMRYIVDDVATIAGKLDAKGFVSIHVNVDAKGNAAGVKVMNTPNLDVAKAIAYVLVKAKYKPAVCDGVPCDMEFPFRFQLQ
jgi:hypothetical protein